MEDLKQYHTRQLMSFLEDFRAGGMSGRVECTYEEIREELATREHIPNKPEARKIRQERAKKRLKRA